MPSASRLRLLLLVATGLFALAMRFVLLAPNQAMWLIRFFGYWLIASIVVMTVVVVVRALKGWTFSRARHGWPLLAAIACAVFMQLHEPRKLKVMYDEYVLVASSLQMHLERQAWVPDQAQYSDGNIVHLSAFVDKRPLLFSFLLSLVHDVSGYRVANVFVLNAIISVALFWFAFWLGEAVGGRRFGYAAMLLVAGIPLVANVTTSGAYDLLNLTLLAVLILVARRFLENPTPDNQNLLVMAGVLIAQTRYESILFLLSLAVVVAVAWWRTRRIELTWLAILSPLMVLLPLLSNYVYVSNEDFFESKKLGVAFFDIAHFSPNIERAVFYLFNFSGRSTNSPLVSYLGFASLLLVLVAAPKLIRRTFFRPDIMIILFAFIPVILANTGLILANFWGQLDDPMASRFSLPLHLLLVLAIVVVVAHARSRELGAGILTVIAGIWIWAWTIPTNAQHHATLGVFPTAEAEWEVSQTLEHFDFRTLVVADSALPLVAHRRPAIPYLLFNVSPKEFLDLTTKGTYKQIVIFQTIRVDPETGEEIVEAMTTPPKNLMLETLIETRLHENYISRFSRLIGFTKEAEPEPTVPPPAEPAVPDTP